MTGTRPGQGGQAGDVRYIGDVPGRFVLVDRAASPGETLTFPFSARSVSTTKAVLTAEQPVTKGERVALHFDGIGIRRGVVERVLKGGFTVTFTADGVEEGVGARIGWLNQKTRGRAEDRRQHKRVIPKTTAAILIMRADHIVECRLRDMSASGVAVITTERPTVGGLVAVGAVPGRVVRHFEDGIAVRFTELQDLAMLEGQLTLQTSGHRSLAAKRIGAVA